MPLRICKSENLCLTLFSITYTHHLFSEQANSTIHYFKHQSLEGVSSVYLSFLSVNLEVFPGIVLFSLVDTPNFNRLAVLGDYFDWWSNLLKSVCSFYKCLYSVLLPDSHIHTELTCDD